MKEDLIPVSVIVPVRNEERNLPHCLERLRRFAEILVVDSGSQDRTCEIAREHGADLIQFHWNGAYPKKRNWVLMNRQLRSEWVLFLDADEIVSESFCDEVAAAVAAGEHEGFWLNYTNYFVGKPLRHGDPQRKLALFRAGKALYERIDESAWSSLDMEVHEHPVVEGSVGEIHARIDHRDFRGIDKFIDRHRDYALWEMQRLEALQREQGLEAAHLTPRQRAKYRNLRKWWFPWAYFGYTYIVKRGFLDGGAGFAHAFYKLWYFYTIRIMLRERAAEQEERAA